MTEYNIFCWAKIYNDKDSFQQKRYRVFNKEVGKDRYYELKKLIYEDILKDFKLNLKEDTCQEAWEKLETAKVKRLMEIPEFDAEGFKFITEIDVGEVEKQSLSGTKIKVIVEGKEYEGEIK